MKKLFYRLASAFLGVTFLFAQTPILAQELANSLTSKIKKTGISSKPEILDELPEKRQECVKHFRMSDGSMVAVVYSDQIHYKDGNKFKEIDNTLVEENEEYKNTDSPLKVQISKQFRDQRLVTLNSNNHELSWSYIKKNKKHKTSENLPQTESTETNTESDDDETSEESTDKPAASSESVEVENFKTKSKTFTNKKEEKTDVSKISSKAKYKQIDPDIDLDYTLSGLKLKESIILNKKLADNDSFDFEFQTNGLKIKKDDAGNLNFIDNEGKNIYVMPKGSMWDSAGAYSNNVNYEFSEIDGGYIISVIPNQEWLNDSKRLYPIFIDPSITEPLEMSGIQDTYTYTHTSDLDTNFEGLEKILVGLEAAGQEFKSYMKFVGLPTLNHGEIVTNAKLDLRLYNYQTSPSNRVQVKSVNGPWDVNTLTAGHNIKVDSTVVDYASITESNAWYSWDITKLAKQWYTLPDPNINNGFELSTQISDVYGYGEYVSTENTTQPENRPRVEISYKNFIGEENYWSYTGHGAGLRGVGKVNNYTGTLSINENILAYSGLRNPLAISNIYNSINCNEHANNYVHNHYISDPTEEPGEIPNPVPTQGYTHSSSTGQGWRLSFNQLIYPISQSDPMYSQSWRYIYADKDGTQHYFQEITKDEITKFVDEDGLGFEIVPDLNDNDKLYIKDKGDNKLTFEKLNASDSCYVLTALSDNEENTTVLTYGSNPSAVNSKVTAITDAAGRVTTINYSNGLVSSIVDSDNKTVLFTYKGEKLKEVTYPDSLKSGYEYDEDGRLKSVWTNEGTGRCVAYDYSAQKIGSLYYKDIFKNKIKKVTEYGSVTPKSSTIGNFVTFSYDGGNTTKITYGSGNEATNYGKDTENWIFDNQGRMTSIMGENGEMLTQDYYNTSETQADPRNHKVSHRNRCHKHVNNLLKNSAAARCMESWEGKWWKENEPSNEALPDNTSVSASIYNFKIKNQNYSTKAFKITQNESSSEWIVGAQHVTIPKTEKEEYYTLSGDVYIPGELSGGEGAGLHVVSYRGEKQNAGPSCSEWVRRTEYHQPYEKEYGQWRRIHTVIKVPAGTDKIGCFFGLKGSNGKVYFDRLQLEKGNIPNDYNYIENSAFDKDSSNWELENQESGDGLENQSVRFNGNPARRKHIKQESIKIDKINPTFTISCTARSTSVPKTDKGGDLHDPRFMVALKINYAGGKDPKWMETTFNESSVITSRQYICRSIPASEYTLPYNPSSDFVSSVDVYLCYYYNCNSARFDNIQLSTDEAGTSYYYDQNTGNLMGILSKDGESTEFDRDQDSNEIKSTKMLNNYSQNEYDNDKPHRLISTASPSSGGGGGLAKLKTKFTYDNFGNVTKTNLEGDCEGQKFIETSSGYSTSGNYPVSSTDSRGNTTTFSYDENSGNLMNSTTPNNTETEYTYDEADRATSVTSGNSQSAYSYANGALSEIAHKVCEGTTVTYNFVRDIFGKVTHTKIGNQILTSNFYDSCNGFLRGVLFGNSAVVNYDYNKYGALTQKSFSGEKGEGKFDYDYNNKGQLYQIRDSVNEKNTVFTYNQAGRIASVSRNDDVQKNYYYTANGLMHHQTLSCNGVNQAQYNSFLPGNRLKGSNVTTNGIDFSSDYLLYDHLGRKKHLALSSSANPSAGLISYWNYLDVEDTNKTTSLVKDMIYKLRKNSTYENDPVLKFSYDYDNMGNISVVKENDVPKVWCFYDEHSQLIRENNQKIGKTITYAYDFGGNIQFKTVYNFTDLQDLSNETPENIVDYGYSDSNWKDKMTSYGNEEITYDSVGNPIQYRNGWNFEWKNGRQLDKASNQSYNVTYKYDDGGIRTSKTVNGITTEYITDGIQVLAQKTGNDKIIWQIDGNGEVLGFIYNNDVYYYLKNAQDDIVKILDKDSNVVAKYVYDSWGKVLNVFDANGTEITDLSHVAHVNPLRYRGYYYDSELELYYLNARYYDPETGRFINADDEDILLEEHNDILDYNLFAYCLNNPVNYYDPSGEVAVVDDVVVVTLVGGTVLTMATANYYTWLASADGQKAINEGAKAVDSAGKAISNAAKWVGDKAKETWDWAANLVFAEHTKNKRPSTHDKHTKPRSGRSNTKNRLKPDWKGNPNKRR